MISRRKFTLGTLAAAIMAPFRPARGRYYGYTVASEHRQAAVGGYDFSQIVLPTVQFRCNVGAQPAHQYRKATGSKLAHIRAFIDGREITDVCTALDVGQGWARCYTRAGKFFAGLRNDDGSIYPVEKLDGEGRRFSIDPLTGRFLQEFHHGVITTDPPAEELARVLGPVCWDSAWEKAESAIRGIIG